MRSMILTAALLFVSAQAQVIPPVPTVTPPVLTVTPPVTTVPLPSFKAEIQDVEITAPASTGPTPTLASDDVGEVPVPVLVTDQAGQGLAGVALKWEIKNTGKAPVYIISMQSGEDVKPLTATITPGATYTFETLTGKDGRASVLLNATGSTAALLKVTGPGGEVKNLRGVAQSVDWIL